MITTTIDLDISRDQHASDRRAMSSLYGIRDGSTVSLNVGDRWIIHPQVADQLRQYVQTLHLNLHGSQRAIESWANALHNAGWADV